MKDIEQVDTMACLPVVTVVQRPRCGRVLVMCKATWRQYIAVGRALGRDFENQGSCPCRAFSPAVQP